MVYKCYCKTALTSGQTAECYSPGETDPMDKLQTQQLRAIKDEEQNREVAIYRGDMNRSIGAPKRRLSNDELRRKYTTCTIES